MPQEKLPEKLFGDKLRMQQILINLIKNALKFSLKGTVRIIAAYDKEQQMLKVHVHDNGKGIRKEEMSKLFTLFGKLKRTAEQNTEGIGMGLMICQNLVRMCGGTIEVYSEGENKGSVFTFSMQMIFEGESPAAVPNTGGTFFPNPLLKPSTDSEYDPQPDSRREAFLPAR